jgi:hypothetical protein
MLPSRRIWKRSSRSCSFAAIDLTPEAGTEFTVDQLLARVREIDGDEVRIDETDARIVLDKAAFLKKQGKKFVLR